MPESCSMLQLFFSVLQLLNYSCTVYFALDFSHTVIYTRLSSMHVHFLLYMGIHVSSVRSHFSPPLSFTLELCCFQFAPLVWFLVGTPVEDTFQLVSTVTDCPLWSLAWKTKGNNTNSRVTKPVLTPQTLCFGGSGGEATFHSSYKFFALSSGKCLAQWQAVCHHVFQAQMN